MIQLDSIVWRAGAFRLDNVSFTVPAGKYAVLMGRTGCGKTTLLEIICGLRQPRGGRVIVADRDVTHELPGERGIGYVPQDGAMFPTFTVREQLGFALRLRRRPSDEINTRVSELAGELGVAHLLDRLPQHLSGGERQRAAVARALINSPKLLLADEPTGALDRASAERLADLLAEVHQREKITIVMVTHAPELARRMGRMLGLVDGKLADEKRPTA